MDVVSPLLYSQDRTTENQYLCENSQHHGSVIHDRSSNPSKLTNNFCYPTAAGQVMLQYRNSRNLGGAPGRFSKSFRFLLEPTASWRSYSRLHPTIGSSEAQSGNSHIFGGALTRENYLFAPNRRQVALFRSFDYSRDLTPTDFKVISRSLHVRPIARLVVCLNV